MGLAHSVEDLRAFHHVAPPKEPSEFRVAGFMVKGLTYLALVFPAVLPGLLLLGVLGGRVAWSAVSGNWIVLLAVLGAIPTFILLAFAYPAFVQGERWSLWAIGLVGFGLLALTPARFLTEAAHSPGRLAIPPTRVEWGIFAVSAFFLYYLLSPETRSGMRAARARQSLRPGRRGPDGKVRYVCPNCGRLYHLGAPPTPGTLCPRCRR